MLLRYVRQGKEKFILFQRDFVGKRAARKGGPSNASTRGTSKVMCRLRAGAARAEEHANKRVGILPMRNGSGQGEAQQDESANSCIYNICQTTPVDERPRFAETFCGIVYRANYISLSILLPIRSINF